MSGQIITIRGTQTKCWIVTRYSRDEAAQGQRSCEEDWMEFLTARMVLDYAEFIDPVGTLRSQSSFVFRRAPIVC